MPTKEQEAYFVSYIDKQTEFPLVEGKEVLFVTKSAAGQPYILADFNGFLNSRYTKSKSIGLMKQISKTSWYYFSKALKPDAVINYKFSDGHKEWIDSLNHHKRSNFGEDVSFVSLKSIQQNVVERAPKENRGKLITKTIESEVQNHVRTVHIYIPSNYEHVQEFPFVYFHDGSFFTEDMLVHQILDFLISKKIIEPVVAIFDNPVVRGKEYRGDTAYIKYVKDELVPYISNNFKVSRLSSQRAVIGFSRGGMSAFYLAYSTGLFSKLGALSPAIYPTAIDDFIKELDNFSHKPAQVFITGAFYDYFWYDDAQGLVKALKQRDTLTNYIESAEGHNIPSWQKQIDNVLISFFQE